MPKHSLNKPNEVRGDRTIEKGRLTFTSGDSAMIQRLELDRVAGRTSTVWLLAADPLQDVAGTIESVELISTGRPQCWRVVMKAKLQK